jgi:hypothetical protein
MGWRIYRLRRAAPHDLERRRGDRLQSLVSRLKAGAVTPL